MMTPEPQQMPSLPSAAVPAQQQQLPAAEHPADSGGQHAERVLTVTVEDPQATNTPRETEPPTYDEAIKAPYPRPPPASSEGSATNRQTTGQELRLGMDIYTLDAHTLAQLCPPPYYASNGQRCGDDGLLERVVVVRRDGGQPSDGVANYATAPTNNNRRHSQDSTATTACSSEPAKRVHKNVEHVLNWCKCGAMVLLIATLVFCLLAKVYASVMSK